MQLVGELVLFSGQLRFHEVEHLRQVVDLGRANPTAFKAISKLANKDDFALADAERSQRGPRDDAVGEVNAFPAEDNRPKLDILATIEGQTKFTSASILMET